VVFSLLGYFVSMIIVLTAAVGVMIGLSNFSTSEKVHHYPRPAVERNFTATNSEPRLFMSVPDTKNGSPTKNIEASSTVAPDEQAEAKTSRPHKHKAIARQRNNYERPGFGMGYAEYTRNGPQRPFFNW
jgi:hypothetical protein